MLCYHVSISHWHNATITHYVTMSFSQVSTMNLWHLVSPYLPSRFGQCIYDTLCQHVFPSYWKTASLTSYVTISISHIGKMHLYQLLSACLLPLMTQYNFWHVMSACLPPRLAQCSYGILYLHVSFSGCTMHLRHLMSQCLTPRLAQRIYGTLCQHISLSDWHNPYMVRYVACPPVRFAHPLFVWYQ